MADDIYSEKVYLKEKKVTVEVNYRLGFDADRTCGYSRIFHGDLSGSDPEDENYEIYQELYECGLDRATVEQRFRKLVGEINDGKIDVSF